MDLEFTYVHWSHYQDGWLALLQNHITGCGTQPPHLQGVVSFKVGVPLFPKMMINIPCYLLFTTDQHGMESPIDSETTPKSANFKLLELPW